MSLLWKSEIIILLLHASLILLQNFGCSKLLLNIALFVLHIFNLLYPTFITAQYAGWIFKLILSLQKLSNIHTPVHVTQSV